MLSQEQRKRSWKLKTVVLFAMSAMLLTIGMATSALAVGTLAGTTISNQAYVDYNDANGNALPRVFSNTVTTTVSQVAGLYFDPPTASDAGSNTTTVMYLVQVFNSGNGNDTFNVTYAVPSGWTPTSVQFYHDVDNSHSFNVGDTLMTPVSGTYTTGSVAPDDDYDILVFVTIPAPGIAADGSSSTLRITATSNFDGGVTGFGDYTTTVTSAVVTANKLHSPAGLNQPPGTVITYTVTLTNSGSSSATSTVLTDLVPANMTYVPGSITLNSVAKTDANDGDGVNYNVTTPGAVTVSAGTINSGGGVATIAFQATIDANVPSGTAISNQATIVYHTGPNTINISSNSRTFFVSTAAAVDLAATTVALSGNPSDQIIYPFTLTNNGNASDVIDITYTSTQGWTWAFWEDANNNGAVDGGDALLTDTDADGKIDSGTLAQYGSIRLLAVATIPPGSPDTTVDALTVTATSSNDVTVFDTQGFTTTVTAPILTITKTVSPTGAQPPTTVLTYTTTVTNVGTGVGKLVTITDPIPANTTYVPGSIKTGATVGSLASKTDAADVDIAAYDAVSNLVVIGGAGLITLGPSGTLVMQFQVTIN